MRSAMGLLILVVVAAPCFGVADTFEGDWSGRIVLPGTALEIAVHLEQRGGGWAGTIDIPAQGARGLALGDFSIAGDSISFVIAGVPGTPTFSGVRDGDTIAGPFTQGGQTFSFELSRGAIEESARPQDPKPPFPYQSEEVTFEHDGVTLAGTLTLPAGGGPFPAVVLLTGSGAQDRNEEIFNHRPFLVIADHLSRHGIAVLRYDDRGVGGSTGASHVNTTVNFADDALAAVSFLHERDDVAADRVGLLGHSEGALIATMAAEKSSDIAYVILLAGPGVSGAELLPVQIEALARANGVSDSLAAVQRDTFRKIVSIVSGDRDSTEVADAIAPLLREHISTQPVAASLDSAMIDQVVSQNVRQLSSPWFRFFLTYDPRPALRRITCPVLALNGALDRQVVPEQNLTAVEQALAQGGNPDVTVREMPGLNHLFQHATTGSTAEYAQIDETIAPEVLDLIREWIAARSSTR